ncbi:hypothetical protein ACQEV4_08110 [Streptomyces shenzhenensis]|uniref:hypothetical protein n=1 Tax=Streptomyces shenzhenensis TaxID=943815 RepID=UPI003D92B417
MKEIAVFPLKEVRPNNGCADSMENRRENSTGISADLATTYAYRGPAGGRGGLVAQLARSPYGTHVNEGQLSGEAWWVR